MIKRLDVVQCLTYIYFILKPYYIFPSGNIQIADYFLLLAFLLLIISSVEKNNISERVKLFCSFVICITIISTIYSIIYFRIDFMTSTLFYMFNLMGIFVLYYCIKSRKFLKTTKNICSFNIIVQIIIYFLKLGEWYGNARYMGTFNDPNQFAFFIFSSMIIIYIIENILNSRKNYIFYILPIFLIWESASTGMLLGVCVFCAGGIIYYIHKINIKKYSVKIVVISGILLPLILIIFLTQDVGKYMNDIIEENLILDRIEEKLERMDKEEGNLLEERGYDKILKYPYQIILGAGHGYNERFDTFHKGEIHATFPSILFYYGLIPFIILLKWIWTNIKNSPPNIKIAYLAILIESLTLLNERQVLFWFMIILGSLYNTKKEENSFE